MSYMKNRLNDREEQLLQEMADSIEEQMSQDEQLAECVEHAVEEYEERVHRSFRKGVIVGALSALLGLLIGGLLK